MKNCLIFLLVFSSSFIWAQYEPLNLKNCLIVGQLEDQDDRFTLEVNLAEIFAECGVKNMPSLNILKRGGDLYLLQTDSLALILKAKGIDTYVLVSVRGFDMNFKLAKKSEHIKDELEAGHLFPLYRNDINSVTLEFNFYRNGKFIGNDLVKLPRTGSRDEVIKKLHKRLPKRINSYWK
jgi:hypothetical protein